MGYVLREPRQPKSRRLLVSTLFAPLSALLFCISPGIVRADGKDKEPDFSKGALYGTVIDTTTGKPLPDATVAVLAPDGKALAWTKTNDEGKYALAADTFNVLHLHPSHRRGLLEEVCRGVGNVVTAPVKVVVSTVSRPGETVKSAVEATLGVNGSFYLNAGAAS